MFKFRALIALWDAGRQLGGGLFRALRQSVLLIAGVYFLSPLYSTLARAISGDTITAASTWLFLAHLYMHDYFFHISVADKLSGSLSMAAAVAGSLLLASRLGDPTKVVRSYIDGPMSTLVSSDTSVCNVQFAQILYSLTAFVLLPFTCQHLKRHSESCFTVTVTLTALLTSSVALAYWWHAAAVYISMQLALVFLCPWWLVHIEKFKTKINGPWDEAMPRLTSLLREQSLQNQMSH